MKIDLTCPVELWQYTTPTPEHPECGFALNNLCDKVVVSVQTTLVCFGEQNKPLFRQVERIQGLNAAPGERFSIALLPSQWEGVQNIDLVIEKVWFDDTTIWRRGSAPLTDYDDNTLPPGRKLDQLRFVAGPDALGYPELQANVWMCICGRPNSLQSDRCCRCERRRESVFATCAMENVEQLNAVHEQKLADAARAAREDASRLAEERARQQAKMNRHKRVVRRTILITVCVTAAGAAALIWGVPALKYAQATTMLKSGAFDDAHAVYLELKGYRDADILAQECDYQKAAGLAASGTEADQQNAVSVYQALADYKDSADLALKAMYKLGQTQLAAEEYDAAADTFQTLGSYADSAAMLRETQYRQADKMLQNGSYVAARILFSDLGDYQDAAQKVAACAYGVGKDALEQKDYETAVTELTAAGDTQGAADLLKQACYQLAQTKQDAGDYEAAGKLYQQAGDYQDAALKANNCLYELGKERMNAGDYAKAAELLSGIAPYLDSETLAWECVYQQALAASAAGNEQQAIDLLVTIPNHTKGAELLKDCRYRLAGKEAAAGNTDNAAKLYEAAGDYKDAATELKKIRYSIAETAFSAGDYDTAAPLYQALGRYKDSADKWKQCQYAVAAAALAAKDYQKAVEGFSELNGYKDSEKQAEAATFALALQLKTTGNTDEAISLLQSLSDNTDAKALLSEITMGEAQKAQKAGELEKAAAMYQALGDYEGAKDGYNQCKYLLAQQKLDAKDYRAALPLFTALGDYSDAAAKARECEQQAYGQYAVPARTAYQSGDWKTVVDTLENFDDSNLPLDYQDLKGMYDQACYNYAEELYNAGKVYEALPYYQRIPDFPAVADQKLQRRCYLILGVWQTADGQQTAIFRADGTCSIFGQTLYFAVDGYALKTGAAADALTLTHKLTVLNKDSLTLRVLTDGKNTVYQLRHLSDETMPDLPEGSVMPAPSVTPTATPAATDPALPTVTRESQTPTPAVSTARPSVSPTPTATPAATAAANENI
jgi:hypothetical protein